MGRPGQNGGLAQHMRNGCSCPDVRVGTSRLGRRDFRSLPVPADNFPNELARVVVAEGHGKSVDTFCSSITTFQSSTRDSLPVIVGMLYGCTDRNDSSRGFFDMTSSDSDLEHSHRMQ